MNSEKDKKGIKIAVVLILIIIIIAIILLLMLGKEKQYSVTFDGNNGSSTFVENVESGALVEEPEEPTREGYVFVGWYLGDEKFDFSNPIEKDMKLEARWEKKAVEVDDNTTEQTNKNYKVKLDNGSEVTEITTDEDGNIKDLPTPTKKGYKFLGWYLDGKKVDSTTVVDEDVTLTAKWEKEEEKKETTSKEETTDKKPSNDKESETVEPQVQKYKVVIDIDGKKTTKTVEKNSKLPLPSNPEKEGYTFKGWYSGSTAVTASTKVTKDMTVVAKWDSYTFTVELINNDKNSPNVQVKTYKNGSAIKASMIYGKYDGNSNYKLGKYNEELGAIKVISKEQFYKATNYKIEVNGNIVYAVEK